MKNSKTGGIFKGHKDFRESFVENKATCSWADAQQIGQRSLTANEAGKIVINISIRTSASFF